MAKVSLRVYNREIEAMIEGGNIDEAIAHCFHVLKTFSMHLETYRLLGKAFLESRRYGDAADIFQRILAAVPDDFVAHVGMSIIRDDEGKLDEAIWHMERAFEVQPSNAAIQGELRRLYGRRDGVEPPKIRLSRDALANMYAQGELFNQAIAEIRAVLAEDPNRPDLQVMLARAFLRGGHKVEAAEGATNLLNKYPYCLDALRILVEVLPGTARAENTQVYRTRLRMLDPYSAFVTGTVFESDKVADAAVNLDRLDYDPGARPVAGSQSEWAASLGIRLEGEKQRESPPEWLSESPADAAAPASAEIPSGESPAASPAGEEIPDWMRSAGWGEATGAAQEGPVELNTPEPAEPIAQADIPDWLKSMAPPESAAGETPAPGSVLSDLPAEPAASGEGAPDWLNSLQQPAAAQPEDTAPAAGEGMPDWLSSLDQSAAAPAEPSPAQSTEAASAESAEGELPDWLSSLGQPAEQSAEPVAPAQEEGIPDWLQGISAGATAGAAEAAFTPEAPLPEVSIPAEQPPSRTAPQPPAGQFDESTPIGPTGPATPLGIEDDAMAWLESLAAKQGAKPEELLTKPEERLEATPESVQRMAAGLEQPSAPSADQSADLVDEAGPIGPTGPATPLGIEDDAMAWLESLAAKQGAKPEELLTKPEERLEATPESVQRMAAESEPTPEASAPVQPAPESSREDISITSWLDALDTEEKPAEAAPASASVPESQPAQDLPDWLQGLEQPAQSTADQPAGVEGGMPDWLQTSAAAVPGQEVEQAPADEAPLPVSETEAPSEGQPAPEPVPPAGSEEDLPEWLRPSAPVQQTGPVAESATSSEPEMPGWIVDENVPVASDAGPTAADEWVPATEIVPADLAAATPPAVQPAAGKPLASKPAPAQPRAVDDLASVPSQDKDADILTAGQGHLERGQLSDAMQEYAKLIKKGRLVEEVIHDLRAAQYRFPVDVIIWQTLGDAYMRANRLQEALDAYTKAEELLR